MKKDWIQNVSELAIDDNRRMALEIVSAGLQSIDTKEVVRRSITLENNILRIKDKSFDLSLFKKITVVGFGKASIDGALALEDILGSKINGGAVIGTSKDKAKYIETFLGTHPRPSVDNVQGGTRITDLLKDGSEDDLVIVLVSGGGSALFCSSMKECEEGNLLYDAFLKAGRSISEMNTVRKHLMSLKGGALAKLAYPATVVGLIFSDVPGNHFEDVASGPTYKDITTKEDAERIVEEYNLGKFDLVETPKEDMYFEKVHNFVLVSNKVAVLAMKNKSEEFGLQSRVVSLEMYDVIPQALGELCQNSEQGTINLGAGEPKIEVLKKGGRGGRNTHMALMAIKNELIKEDSIFISFASDGLDNSDRAGAIVDIHTVEKFKELGIDVGDYLDRFDSYTAFELSKDLIETGPTGANVSDLMLFIKTNKK